MFFKMVMQKQDRDSERTQFCDMLRLGSRDGVGCHKVWLKKENPLIIKGIVIANVINRTCSILELRVFCHGITLADGRI